MKIGFFKVFSVVSTVGAWAGKAFSDGKIDADEAAELIEGIAAALGVPAVIQLPNDFTKE